MPAERIHTMTEVDEIPREGIADFEGRPHYYVCEWNDAADRYASTFELSPVTPEVLALALEDWAIWQRWWAAFEDRRVAEDSGPALPEDEARHRELAAILDERLRLDPEHCVRAYGEFHPQAGWSGVGLAPHEVCWERCPPRDPLDDRYASFWQRFAAHWIDVLVLLPLSLAVVKLDAISRTTAIAIAVPVAALNLGYTIVGHGRFGKTVGKWAMRIRVARTSGEPIGWRQAWLRSAVDVLFTGVWLSGRLLALLALTDAGYDGLGFMERAAAVAAREPAWALAATWIGGLWYWSEIVTMLFNHRRRAVHDFIAGTVVLSEHGPEHGETEERSRR